MVCWNCHVSFTPAERIIKRSGRSCLEIVCTAHPMAYIRSVCVCGGGGGGVNYLSISMFCFWVRIYTIVLAKSHETKLQMD
jgi:hypothetical protein